MKEVWRKVDKYEQYMISSKGRIAKILKGDSNGKGYRFLKTPDNKRIYIHQLVALEFIPNPNNYPIINHKDGNKENNCISNLEWCNYSHNIKEAYRLGFHKPTVKSVVQKDLTGRIIKKWKSMKEAQDKTGISYQKISRCCAKKQKQAEGFIWEYENEKEE